MDYSESLVALLKALHVMHRKEDTESLQSKRSVILYSFGQVISELRAQNPVKANTMKLHFQVIACMSLHMRRELRLNVNQSLTVRIP